MYVRFTNVDQSGASATRDITVTYEGERYERSLSSKGTVQFPREVAEYLIESDDYAVEATTTESESDSDSGSETDVETAESPAEDTDTDTVTMEE